MAALVAISDEILGVRVVDFLVLAGFLAFEGVCPHFLWMFERVIGECWMQPRTQHLHFRLCKSHDSQSLWLVCFGRCVYGHSIV